jgi:hypothetical protein
MNITIKAASDYTGHDIEEKVTALIYESFKSKFTTCLFSDQEAHPIASTLSQFLCLTKADQIFLTETPHGIGGCFYLAKKNDTYYYLKHLLKHNYSIADRIKVTFLLSLLSHPVKETEIKIVTTETFAQTQITETEGALFSEQVISINIVKDAISGIKGLFGGKSTTYSKRILNKRNNAKRML